MAKADNVAGAPTKQTPVSPPRRSASSLESHTLTRSTHIIYASLVLRFWRVLIKRQ